MPNLSRKASHEYWQQYADPMIHRVLSFMESAETDTADSNHLFDAILNELGKLLENLEKIDLNKLDHQEAFIQLANYLQMNQTLRLLQALDAAKPGAAARLLMHAESIRRDEEDDAGLFLKRNLIFERLRLLARVFSEERLVLIRESLEEK